MNNGEEKKLEENNREQKQQQPKLGNRANIYIYLVRQRRLEFGLISLVSCFTVLCQTLSLYILF